MNSPSQVPDPAVRRLSLYLRQLEALEADGISTVSSRKLAQPLGFTDAQVRKDLTYFGQFGRPGIGYEVTSLIQSLRNIFGTDRVSHALLVGVGNLGKAVAAYQGFLAKGFRLVAVFDSDPAKVGQRVTDLPVQPMTDLPAVASQHDARLAIVAVPTAAAQGVVDQLIAAGIRGILNFAPTRISTPPGVTVRNLDVAAEFEQLNFSINVEHSEMAEQREILIVEDDETNIVFLSEIVEEMGHRYRVARNGHEASSALKEKQPDLVLLDLMMPRRSGIAVYEDMEGQLDLKDIPIIIVTGASEVTGVDLRTGEEMARESYLDDVGRRFGAVLHEKLRDMSPDAFVEKPIDPALLSKKIQEFLP